MAMQLGGISLLDMMLWVTVLGVAVAVAAALWLVIVVIVAIMRVFKLRFFR